MSLGTSLRRSGCTASGDAVHADREHDRLKSSLAATKCRLASRMARTDNYNILMSPLPAFLSSFYFPIQNLPEISRSPDHPPDSDDESQLLHTHPSDLISMKSSACRSSFQRMDMLKSIIQSQPSHGAFRDRGLVVEVDLTSQNETLSLLFRRSIPDLLLCESRSPYVPTALPLLAGDQFQSRSCQRTTAFQSFAKSMIDDHSSISIHNVDDQIGASFTSSIARETPIFSTHILRVGSSRIHNI